jgi:hypothetical protein
MSTEAATFDKKFNAQCGAKRAGLKPTEYAVFQGA